MSNDAQAIIDSTYRAAIPNVVAPGDVIAVVVPAGGSLQITDLEKYLEAPRRKVGYVKMFSAESLAEYVVAHKEEGTALYADVEELTIVGVLNGHVSSQTDFNAAGWGDHRVTFTARTTPEWDAWTGIDGAMLGQEAFAVFIEEHINDIVAPPAADLLELAKTFDAKKNVEFTSAIRLENDDRQLRYTETTAAVAGQQGQITIPSTIEVGFPPFEGAEAYRLTARFRYKISNGHLTLGIVLQRPDIVTRDAFEQVLSDVEGTTEITAYKGRPPT